MKRDNKSNIHLFGEQTSAYFLANYIWSLLFLVIMVLAGVLFLKIIGIVPDNAKEGIANSLKTIIGGPGSFHELMKFGYLAIFISAFPVSWILYVRVRAKYLRDLAIYETMRSVSHLNEPDVVDGMFYRVISSRAYRLTELVFSFISIAIVVALLAFLVWHFLVPPRLQNVEIVHAENEGYFLRWHPSFSTRCSYVEAYYDESEGWLRVESNCLEHNFDSGFFDLDELIGFNRGIYDISYEYEDENIERFKVTVKGVFIEGNSVETTVDDLVVLRK